MCLITANIFLFASQLLTTNECQSNPCQNGGTCVDSYNGFICQCPPNWKVSNILPQERQSAVCRLLPYLDFDVFIQVISLKPIVGIYKACQIQDDEALLFLMTFFFCLYFVCVVMHMCMQREREREDRGCLILSW